MYRRGHVGVTLLAFAPVAYILLPESPFVTLLALVGIHAIEPLPDYDYVIPGLSHRGASHSLLAALIVGAVLGGILWIGSGMISDIVLLTANGTTQPVEVDLLLLDLLGIGPFTISGTQIGSIVMSSSGVDRWAVASFGFAVGAVGIITHLLGDVITYAGIRPLLPFSQWHTSLTSIRADNSAINEGLFTVGGVVLIVAVVGAFI